MSAGSYNILGLNAGPKGMAGVAQFKVGING